MNNEDRLYAESKCIVNPIFFQWGRVVRAMVQTEARAFRKAKNALEQGALAQTTGSERA